MIFNQLPYDTLTDPFTGGVFLAAGDIQNNGNADLIITPDVAGSSRTTIYSGTSINVTANFLGEVGIYASFLAINDDHFRDGAHPAVGDINGDGYDDFVVAAGFGGGPRTSVYDGLDRAKHANGSSREAPLYIVPDNSLFEQPLRNGSYVAVGDVDGDGKADLIGGAGPGGGPRVLVLSGAILSSGSSGSGAALNEPIAYFIGGAEFKRNGIRSPPRTATAIRRRTF